MWSHKTNPKRFTRLTEYVFLKQEKQIYCSAYLEIFQNILQVIKIIGGGVGTDIGLIKYKGKCKESSVRSIPDTLQ